MGGRAADVIGAEHRVALWRWPRRHRGGRYTSRCHNEIAGASLPRDLERSRHESTIHSMSSLQQPTANATQPPLTCCRRWHVGLIFYRGGSSPKILGRGIVPSSCSSPSPLNLFSETEKYETHIGLHFSN